MARLKITAKSFGLKDLISDLTSLASHYPDIVKQSFIEQQKIIEKAVQDNWVSMVGGTYGGRVWESAGYSTRQNAGEGNAYGTVGIYKIDAIESKYGITDSDLTAAQIGYWVEHGTNRLRSGARKVGGVEYDDEDLITVAGIPFISKAYFNTIDEQEEAFAAKWNELIDQVIQ